MSGKVILTEAETLAAVARLDGARLARFVRTQVIRPMATAEGGVAYRQMDVARIELLCDLCDDFGLEDEALQIIMGLLDQLHGTRGDLAALMRALGAEPPEVRARILARMET